MTGAPPVEFSIAACMAKTSSPSLQHALNRSWLLSASLKQRMAVYPCIICRGFHVTKRTDGPDIVLCTFP